MIRKYLLPASPLLVVPVVLALSWLRGGWDEVEDILPGFVGVWIGATFMYLVARLPVSRWLAALDASLIVLPLLTYIVTAVVIDNAANDAGALEFYSASATIIPILLLALAIEGRVFQVQRLGDRPELVGIALMTLALLGFGEYHALKSLFTGEPGGASSVGGAIAAGFIGIAALAVSGSKTSTDDRRA
jgi:hypothetical protein